MDLAAILTILREQGSDTQEIEAKSAHGGYPENIAQTMSAFSNTPGGGTILFGVDEDQGFSIVGVYDAVLCQQAAANTARTALRPQITLSSEVVSHEGKNLVLVHVPEADRDMKPIRVIKPESIDCWRSERHPTGAMARRVARRQAGRLSSDRGAASALG